MRLFELLQEYEMPPVKTVSREPIYYYDYSKEDFAMDQAPGERSGTDRIKKNPKVKTLGAGYFSSVYAHDDNPHDVMKFPRKEFNKTDTDGFRVFISALAEDKEMQSNPYFPRFRMIRKFEKGDEHSYTARMERLFPLDSLETEDLYSIIERIYDDETAAYLYDRASLPHLYFKQVATIVSNTVEKGWHLEKVSDPLFTEAADWLYELGQKEGFYIDLHFNNMMVRRTPYGSQLVISDPLGTRSG
jgi:hypothetical protein